MEIVVKNLHRNKKKTQVVNLVPFIYPLHKTILRDFPSKMIPGLHYSL